MNKIKNIAIKKIKIPSIKYWLYSSFNFCKCFFNKDKYHITEKSTDIINKNIEVSNIIKKHFEIDFIKKLFLNEDELNLFKNQFKYLNIKNMKNSKEYLDNIYAEHLMEDDEIEHQNM
jgi:hypothetical protein